MKQVYIAGPMTGIADFNAAAFAEAEATLRADGCEPVNPHNTRPDHAGDCPDGERHRGHPNACWYAAGLRAVASCDAIYLLPGWRESRGAQMELAEAQRLGIPVYGPGGGPRPKPYYADDQVTLYHGDCREITDWLAADVLVTDPPYGMSYESNLSRDRRNAKKGRPIAGDDTPELRDLALSLWGSRPAMVFGTWRVPRPATARALLIWHKRGAGGLGDLSLPWLPTHEEIYILGRGFVGKRSDAVLSVPPLMSGSAERPDHPTPKPVSLMELLIGKCPPGLIADPFAGSGSTLIAARNLGRKAIGVELEERYCETIANRLSAGVLPLEVAS